MKAAALLSGAFFQDLVFEFLSGVTSNLDVTKYVRYKKSLWEGSKGVVGLFEVLSFDIFAFVIKFFKRIVTIRKPM